IAVQFHHPASHLPSLRRRSAKQEILMISWSLQIVARKVSCVYFSFREYRRGSLELLVESAHSRSKTDRLQNTSLDKVFKRALRIE
ncbi:hypothetical protein, partial [Deinococcus marmoris]|uniref:hypothetical protein n=1 Tax=Deinococcus marmoris TaxID=249408 RepID=UPI0039F08755